ncbi:MAG: FHA domain-containing protein, partial [Lachnospiraceae bacterium]|nr:FHA domain-containing protein [Lachnospiraceae bacterium]
ILQKSTKVDYRIKYNSFREITADLNLRRISREDARFLKKRQAELKAFERIKKKNLGNVFTGSDEVIIGAAPEGQFGVDSAAVLIEGTPAKTPRIRICICSTGQVFEFVTDEIVIGRDQSCDMVLNQPVLSRTHARVRRLSDDEYELEDLNSSNGTYTTSAGKNLVPGQKEIIRKGDIFRLSAITLQIC